MQLTPGNRLNNALKTGFISLVVFATPLFSATVSASLDGARTVDSKGQLLPTTFPRDPIQLRKNLHLPTCNSLSELLLSEGDNYYGLPPLKNKKSQSVKNTPDTLQFSQLLKDIEGNWDGQAIESVCYQTGDSRLQVFEVDELEVEHSELVKRFSTGHRELARVTVDRVRVSSSDRRASSGDVRTVTVFTVPNLSGLHKVEKIADDQFRISRLYRERTTASGATVLREREDWISKTGNKLAWRTDWYTNGHYSGSELNLLNRRR